MGYRYAEDGPTADLTVDAWGDTLGETFTNVALAMFNAMTPLEEVVERVSRSFEVEGDDLGALLFNFLDELLYIHEVELLVFSAFKVEIDEEKKRLQAECSGERFEIGRHQQGIAIKAVTFHDMRMERRDGGWAIRTVLDT